SSDTSPTGRSATSSRTSGGCRSSMRAPLPGTRSSFSARRGGLHAVPGLRGGEGGTGVALRGGPAHPARAFGRAARGPRRAVPRDGPRRALVSGARDAPLALTPGGAFDRLRLAVETARGTPRAVLRGPLMSP